MRAIRVRAVFSVVLLVPLLAQASTQPSATTPPERATYSVEFHVYLTAKDPGLARVRWKFAGIDELRKLRLHLSSGNFYDFSGTGTLIENDGELVWQPKSPYAHLEYHVDLRHRRSANKGFDSYAGEDWLITRAKRLFPRVRATYENRIEVNPLSRGLLIFHLPDGWQAVTAMERVRERVFRPERVGRILDRPSGWFALGRLQVKRRTIDGTRVTVAKSRSSNLDSEGVLDHFEKTLPALKALLGAQRERLLVVSGPDPMWRGGISGKDSFYLHGDRPIRTPDRTSPPLHEVFHVLAPFRAAEDGEWVTEGLTEFYSLAIQHRTGVIRDRDFQRGLRLFERYGDWHVNLTARGNLAATNNSAPLIVYAIDRAIRERTKGERSLDDVVKQLAARKETVSTAGFLRVVNAVGGHNFTPFFQRHVYAGVPPRLDELVPKDGKGHTGTPSRPPRTESPSEEVSDREVDFPDRFAVAPIELESVVEADGPDGGLVAEPGPG